MKPVLARILNAILDPLVDRLVDRLSDRLAVRVAELLAGPVVAKMPPDVDVEKLKDALKKPSKIYGLFVDDKPTIE